MMVVGLTGNLGSGKSTVLTMFRDFGAEVIDADSIAHDLIQPKGACFDAVRKAFPAAYVDGRIQRNILAEIVFDFPRKLKKLERILHPAVRKEIVKCVRKLIKKPALRMVVVDVPLLYEVKFDDLFDVIIVVKINQRLQYERLKKSRNMSRTAVQNRLKYQIKQAEKLKRADFIVDNRYTKAKTRAQVKQIWDGLV